MQRFVDAVRQAISDENYYAALSLSLTIPDIATKLENPANRGRSHYKAWCETYLQPMYTKTYESPGHILGQGEKIWLGAADTYALRCAFLHEGGDDISGQQAQEALDKFKFVYPGGGLSVHRVQVDKKLLLSVDKFCEDVCKAADAWITVVANDSAVQQRMRELMDIEELGPGFSF